MYFVQYTRRRNMATKEYNITDISSSPLQKTKTKKTSCTIYWLFSPKEMVFKQADISCWGWWGRGLLQSHHAEQLLSCLTLPKLDFHELATITRSNICVVKLSFPASYETQVWPSFPSQMTLRPCRVTLHMTSVGHLHGQLRNFASPTALP